MLSRVELGQPRAGGDVGIARPRGLVGSPSLKKFKKSLDSHRLGIMQV